MHRGQTEEKKKENLRREKKIFFFLLHSNGPASFVRCGQLFVIKFFLLGPPPGLRKSRGASPFVSLTHTGPFSRISPSSCGQENRSRIPDPALASSRDESTGAGIKYEGKQARLGLETGSVTWFSLGAGWTPLSSQGPPDSAPISLLFA